jgi:hypothetical protein
MRGRKPNILEKATSLICLYRLHFELAQVPSDGNARSGVNEFESICFESLVDEEDLGKSNTLEKATSFICFARIQSRSFQERRRWTAGRGYSLPRFVVGGECIQNGLQRKVGKCRRKDVEERQRTSTAKLVGSKRATSLCTRTVRMSGVGGLQVDLEKELVRKCKTLCNVKCICFIREKVPLSFMKLWMLGV